MKSGKCCTNPGGRTGHSGQNRRASGTGQSRVNAMHDTGSMSSSLQGKIYGHPKKDGALRKL